MFGLLQLASIYLIVTALPPETHLRKRATADVLQQRFDGFRDECTPRPSGGCNCKIKDASGMERMKTFTSEVDCKTQKQVIQTALNKKKLNEEIRQRYGNFKENCFAKPSGGCRCNEKDSSGQEVVRTYNNDSQCKVVVHRATTLAETTAKKSRVMEEIKNKYGDLKANCFPKPSGGCRCNIKDATGNDAVTHYSSDHDCKMLKDERSAGKSQNVRDPVRERAQANYAAVLNELHNKFKGLKEGCYPRPKGCLCVIGKDKDGRDITDRRMNDRDCKCEPGTRGDGCPGS